MNRTIVVGYREGEDGDDAIALARALAAGTSGRVEIVSVLEYARTVSDTELVQTMRQEQEQAMARLTDGWPAGVTVSVRAITGESAARAIHEHESAGGENLVVLAASRRGPVGRVLIGTTAEQLLHGGTCPVAVAPRGYAETDGAIRTIGVAYDGSPESKAAVDWAAGEAPAMDARLLLIGISDPPPVETVGEWGMGWGPQPPRVDYLELAAAFRERVRQEIESALADLPPDVRAEPVLREGDPALELEAIAEGDVDLLVLGSRGFGPAKSVLLGSVSAKVMRSAAVPTVVVPRPGPESDAG